ncbi:MAG: hypothetical protein NTX63_04810 [Candidatus Peregrinibacteria bacterium]|nr:hypothetical protein [Candidatus Peregrinibacteria bacterium]
MKKITKIIVALTLGIWLISATSVYAQAILPKPKTLSGQTEEQQAQYNKAGGSTTGGYGVTVIIPFVTTFSIGFAGTMAFVALVYGGVLYVSTFGDETQTGKAKKIIMWALIGLVLTMFSYAFVQIILKLKIG